MRIQDESSGDKKLVCKSLKQALHHLDALKSCLSVLFVVLIYTPRQKSAQDVVRRRREGSSRISKRSGCCSSGLSSFASTLPSRLNSDFYRSSWSQRSVLVSLPSFGSQPPC
jgi:hypothetical protein